MTTRVFSAVSLCVLLSGAALAQGPLPVGSADVSFSYQSSDGRTRTLQSSVDYSGVGPGDVIPLGGDANIGYFNSVNAFGRRTVVPGGLRPNESLLSHAFFKPAGHSTDFFANMAGGADVTLSVQNIHFDQPVFVQQDTVLLHKLWDSDQVDQVDAANGFLHTHVHNHNTQENPFRDFDAFFPPNVFEDNPANYSLGDLPAMQVSGDGTNTLGFVVTLPYSIFRHFEEDPANPLTVPSGLPAPGGFLEPFHFHYEFAVSSVPEPGALLLIGLGALTALRRR